ncbi:phage portal protein [Sphingosinicella sp.]|uniref:phage portal protein n=1 Tax=Sphingosinicella sp. TaxID=1917971 RepID=UPI004037993F
MKWFGRKAARGGGRPFLLAGLPLRFADAFEERPASYEARVREAYLANPVAQRAVRLVAESVAWAPIYADQSGTLIREEAPPPRFARSPSPRNRGEDLVALVPPGLLETVATQLLLHGNAFVRVVQDARAEPVELVALRPERVRIEADGRGWPAAYLYKVGEAASRFEATDALGRPGVIHLKAAHPLDDHYGLGCLGAAAAAVELHNLAARWHRALLLNAARPSGALVYDPPDGAALSADQFARLKEELAAQFSGAANAGRPLLLDGGLKWQALSLTPADMDIGALKAAAARDIALAFGVPPMLLGLPGDATYANYREANRALWRLTVLPMAERILRGIGDGLAAWRPGLKFAIDVDQVTALAEDRERLWRQVRAAEFLSEEEKREMLGSGPAEGGDTQ